ncbi:DnaJ-like protein xdj1 [Entomophthora muscae]|uniref:DnaJ-like protein xdj1 n=1 Tax=Entomophthora muscae TaxID=34485 RepID=A0ACC2SS55_9FUNG|nr:DnaJ-like protein xdj1 [Entomophthora muscae]
MITLVGAITLVVINMTNMKICLLEIFSMPRHQGYERSQQKSPRAIIPYSVTLEDLYKGKSTKLRSEKKIACGQCYGVGGKPDSAMNCGGCDGRGVTTQIRQVGQGNFQQLRVSCTHCEGTGKVFKKKDKCKKCRGAKTQVVQKVLTLFIDKGMVNKQKIVFAGEADQEPGSEPGDLVIELVQKDHPVFERKGSDLLAKASISLKEALCGTNRSLVTHLDGRGISVQFSPGHLSGLGQVIRIKGEGMPQFKRPFDKGDLYITLEVVLPTANELSAMTLNTLKQILPNLPNMPSSPDLVESTDAEKASLQDFGRIQAAGEDYIQLESEENAGFPGMQCNQQ